MKSRCCSIWYNNILTYRHIYTKTPNVGELWRTHCCMLASQTMNEGLNYFLFYKRESITPSNHRVAQVSQIKGWSKASTLLAWYINLYTTT